jgi:hypothetical protein
MEDDHLLCIGLFSIDLEAEPNLGMEGLALTREVPIDHRSVAIAGNNRKRVVTIGGGFAYVISGKNFHGRMGRIIN